MSEDPVPCSIPTKLLYDHLDVMLRVITNIINSSVTSGIVTLEFNIIFYSTIWHSCCIEATLAVNESVLILSLFSTLLVFSLSSLHLSPSGLPVTVVLCLQAAPSVNHTDSISVLTMELRYVNLVLQC